MRFVHELTKWRNEIRDCGAHVRRQVVFRSDFLRNSGSLGPCCSGLSGLACLCSISSGGYPTGLVGVKVYELSSHTDAATNYHLWLCHERHATKAPPIWYSRDFTFSRPPSGRQPFANNYGKPGVPANVPSNVYHPLPQLQVCLRPHHGFLRNPHELRFARGATG